MFYYPDYSAHVDAFYLHWFSCDKCGSLDDFYGPTCSCYGTVEITY